MMSQAGFTHVHFILQINKYKVNINKITDVLIYNAVLFSVKQLK